MDSPKLCVRTLTPPPLIVRTRTPPPISAHPHAPTSHCRSPAPPPISAHPHAPTSPCALTGTPAHKCAPSRPHLSLCAHRHPHRGRCAPFGGATPVLFGCPPDTKVVGEPSYNKQPRWGICGHGQRVAPQLVRSIKHVRFVRQWDVRQVPWRGAQLRLTRGGPPRTHKR